MAPRRWSPLLVKTDEGNDSVYKNMTTFLVEKEPGFGEIAPGLTIPGKIDKMGYKGVDTTEAIFENHKVSADQVLGGETGKGFYQMMDGVEVGRVNVAARAVGVANRAFELGISYAQQRETFGKPIAQHQAILFQLAEMATKVETAHAMMVRAARIKDRGERNDVEAGMAKYLAAEYCNEVVQQSFRIHGGYGYSKEYEIERLYREAAFLLIGEGTAEIQKMIIGRSAAQGLQAQELIRQGWYGGATPQPQRGTGARSTGCRVGRAVLHGEPAAPLGVPHQRGARLRVRRDARPCPPPRSAGSRTAAAARR